MTRADVAGAAGAEAGAPASVDVELVWVEADQTIARRVFRLSPGSRVADALAALHADEGAASVSERLACGELQTAIFGERCEPGAMLHPGDRIELLAGLSVDPKVARQRRAENRRAAAPRGRS